MIAKIAFFAFIEKEIEIEPRMVWLGFVLFWIPLNHKRTAGPSLPLVVEFPLQSPFRGAPHTSHLQGNNQKGVSPSSSSRMLMSDLWNNLRGRTTSELGICFWTRKLRALLLASKLHKGEVLEFSQTLLNQVERERKPSLEGQEFPERLATSIHLRGRQLLLVLLPLR